MGLSRANVSSWEAMGRLTCEAAAGDKETKSMFQSEKWPRPKGDSVSDKVAVVGRS